MCIKCKNREMLADVAGQVLDMSDALIDAFQLIERLKAKASALDPDEQKVYDRLSRYVRGQDAEAPADTQGSEVPGGLMDALKAAFPGATIITGSPEEVEAMIEKTIRSNGRKPN